MSYDEEQHKRSRVVIETPTERREVVQHQTVRYPEERRGYSAGVLAAVALTAIAATAIIFLFLTNSGDEDSSTNVNVRASVPVQPTPYAALPPVVVQTPMTMPTPQTIIVSPPPPVTTTMPPVVVQQPATVPPPTTTTAPPTTTTTAPPASAPPASANDDATLQEKVDSAFAADAEVTSATIDTRVINGKVFLTGTVGSDALKQKAEKLAYAVKGVRSVENRIIVSP